MILVAYNLTLFVIDLAQLIWRAGFLIIQTIFQLIIRPGKKSVAGENVLITGAAHGLGRELALEFARRGARIVIWDINQEGSEQTAAEVRQLGGKALAYHCDVSNRDSVAATAQQVFEEFGQITILINNAGIMPVQPFNYVNHQQIKRVVDVNVMSHFWAIHEFLPKMMDMGHGHVIAISSLAGRLGLPNLQTYSTSKFAIAGLMESLSEEFRYYKGYPDIHFTTVFPTLVATGFFKNPRIKYPWLTPIMEPNLAAMKIIDGIQRNAEHIYLPTIYEYAYRILPILPRKVQHLVLDFFDCGLNPQD